MKTLFRVFITTTLIPEGINNGFSGKNYRVNRPTRPRIAAIPSDLDCEEARE